MQAPESTAKKPLTSVQQSVSRQWYTIQRTAFRIFHRIFEVYSLPTDCHMAGRQSTTGLGQ
eukprot:5429911-Pyramimonas_sp.AAC.1